MTAYSCTSSTSHPPTNQNHWVGCLTCSIDEWDATTDFFRPKHVHKLGDPIPRYVSKFTYDPANKRLSIDSTGETVTIENKQGFLDHWMESARGELMWNPKHESANYIVRKVGYGLTGSYSTAEGEFTSDVSGVLIAKALTDAHPFPVNPGRAEADLVSWPWKCQCGAMCMPEQTICLGCRQKGAEE